MQPFTDSFAVAPDEFDLGFEEEVADEAPAAGFTPLGMLPGKAVVFSHLQKAVVTLGASDMGEVRLKMLLGEAWHRQMAQHLQQRCIAEGERTPGSGHRLVVGHIIGACQAVGTYVPSLERKTGVWADDSGALVINSDVLWTSDGATLRYGKHGRYIYSQGRPMGFGLETPPATAEEVERVMQTFRSYAWMMPGAPELMLGWIGVAMAAGAMRRRPHLLITGQSGCGKSTLLEIVSHLLGSRMAMLTGNPSWMGLHQLVHDDPTKSILVDEFEANGSDARCADTFEASRASYSATEADSGVVRGSPDGGVRTYRIRSPFAATAVSPGRMEPADLSRWVILDTRPMPHGGQALTRDEATALGQRLARLFVSRWHVFASSLEPMRDAIQAAGGNARMADTFGHLVTAYWAFTNVQPVTADEAGSLVERLGLPLKLEDKIEQDEQECLTALLTRVLTFQCVTSQGPQSQKLSVGEAVRHITRGDVDSAGIAEQLTRLGLRVVRQNGRWLLMVAASHNHVELKKLFAGTKWSDGGWATVLKRLPGGMESTQRLGSGLKACKVALFELPEDLQPKVHDASD